jgi:hypothetical protein
MMTEQQLIAWFRALPAGTVLVDDNGHAWQVCERLVHSHDGTPMGEPTRHLFMITMEAPYGLADDEDLESVIESAPFTVVHMPPVGMPDEDGDD